MFVVKPRALAAIFGVLFLHTVHDACVFVFREKSEKVKHLHSTHSPLSSLAVSCRVPKYLEPMKHRLELGGRLEAEGLKIGAELGVKEGFFARDTLRH